MYKRMSILLCKDLQGTSSAGRPRAGKHCGSDQPMGFGLHCIDKCRSGWCVYLFFSFFDWDLIYELTFFFFLFFFRSAVFLDLVDGGAAHIASTISKIKQKAPNILVEALTPDFATKGVNVIHTVASSGLDVFAHNVETVERCTPFVRDRRAGFNQSLKVLEEAKKGAKAAGKEILTKSSIMLGVGEMEEEIHETLRRQFPSPFRRFVVFTLSLPR